MNLNGLYRGVVTDAQDPSANGRVKVRVADLGGNDVWAVVVSPIGVKKDGGFVSAGAAVIVGFERGDPSRPVVLGRIG